MSSQTITIKLSRGDNTSWGFRLQGGKDFSTPLSVQRVNPGSLSDNAGLSHGDAILKIMGMSTENMKHKEAQDHIMKCGNNLELLIQRGGVRVWKPTVTPVGDLPRQSASPTSTNLYTKTSLAANKQEFKPIGSKHNVSARPFANLGGGRVLVNNQYNTPAPLYSMNNIAETLSQHTEVLSSGAKGINFMKEPGPVNKDSAVYKLIMEEANRSEDTNHVVRKDSPVTQHVLAPITKPQSQTQPEIDPNTCVECGKGVVGVFVRIKGRALHPECFRCSTCGTSLKNQGYFTVNEKLYCDMHAKLASRVVSSTPTYEPITLSQIGETPCLDNKPRQQTPTSAGPMSPTPFLKSDVHRVDSPLSPQPITPPVFKSTGPTFPISTPVAPFKPCPLETQTSVLGTQTTSNTFHQQQMSGSKFVWPPQKNVPFETPLPSTTTAPAAPTYRPPPGTQHFVGVFPRSMSSPMSPPPPQVAPILKTPPATSPKPHTPVQATPRHQGLLAAGPGHTKSWSTTSTSGISSSIVTTDLISSGVGGTRAAPRRGRGQMKTPIGAGTRIPICSICGSPIRGPFVTAMGKTWCPEHFVCNNNRCQRPLIDIGFVENHGQLYCETCYEVHLAPICAKCSVRIKGHCLNALDKQWHPDCFYCAHCHKPFGNSSFYMEDGLPYCEKDWNELFTTKCVTCGYPIEAGDRWVEALNNNYHSQCFRCSKCLKNLEGQSFYAKGGRPFCKMHAR